MDAYPAPNHPPPSPLKAVFCYQFCTLGGCETVLSTRLRELHAQGVEAHALFLEGGDGKRLFRELDDWVSICSEPGQVEAKLDEVQPDFLISLDTLPICKHLARRPQSLRFVYEVHSTYPEALQRLRQVLRYRLSALFTPSNAQRELVASMLGGALHCPVKVVPNPLHKSFHADEEPPAAGRPIVLWVGRLDPHKNWRGFIEIGSRLHRRRPEVEYWVIGTSKISEEEKNYLWEEVKKAGVSTRFRWLPHVPYDQMGRLLRFVGGSGGCLVSTSRQESFGMAAAEAMACHCPVVVPDVGGFRDFVIPEATGYRYPAGDNLAAIACIEKTLLDLSARARIIAAGRQRVQQDYSAQNAVGRLVATLEELRKPAAEPVAA